MELRASSSKQNPLIWFQEPARTSSSEQHPDTLEGRRIDALRAEDREKTTQRSQGLTSGGTLS